MAQDIDPMTFEDLSSAYRVEMKSQLLAETRKDLYPALTKLQDTIQKEYEAEFTKDPDSLTCEGMNERRKKTNNLVQKVIDLRMEKVAMLALRASMGANNILDKLTSEERDYYNSVATDSKKHRNTVLKDGARKNYVIPDISPAVTDNVKKKTDAPVAAPAANNIGTDPAGEEIVERPRRVVEEPREELITIRILEDLPRLAGPDCDYDLKKENVVSMPATLANALINHEKAVRLNVTP
jgi:DNA replication initiation complex subunit (GINS family)